MKNALTPSANGSEFGRRSVLKAAAWSLPVVAVAVATPLAAASTTSAEFVAVSVDTTPNTFQTSWGSSNPDRQGPSMRAGETIEQIGYIQNVGQAAGTLAANGVTVKAVFVATNLTPTLVVWSEPTLSPESVAAGWVILSRTVNVVSLSFTPSVAAGQIAPPYVLRSVAQLLPGYSQAVGNQHLTVTDPTRAEPVTTVTDPNGRPGVIFSNR